MNNEDLMEAAFWTRMERYIARHHLQALFDEPRTFMEQTEYIYDQVRQGLTPEEDSDLVLHVASCEEFCKVYALIAYQMGLEDGGSGTTL